MVNINKYNVLSPHLATIYDETNLSTARSHSAPSNMARSLFKIIRTQEAGILQLDLRRTANSTAYIRNMVRVCGDLGYVTTDTVRRTRNVVRVTATPQLVEFGAAYNAYIMDHLAEVAEEDLSAADVRNDAVVGLAGIYRSTHLKPTSTQGPSPGDTLHRLCAHTSGDTPEARAAQTDALINLLSRELPAAPEAVVFLALRTYATGQETLGAMERHIDAVVTGKLTD